jgi:hypothetical protein
MKYTQRSIRVTVGWRLTAPGDLWAVTSLRMHEREICRALAQKMQVGPCIPVGIHI